MVWGKRNTPITVPMTNERQRQTYYGAINLLTQTVHLQEQPRGEGSNTVAYLRWCQSLYPNKKLLVLWDGASYHRGAERQPFLAQENAGLNRATRHWDTQAASCEVSAGGENAACSVATAAVTSGV
jgi:hypothetical protein